ncbi:MAG: hypothetical protein Q9179_000195 [Wetmoreana sp. 5 TL-2023]
MVVPRTSPRWATGLLNTSTRAIRAGTRTRSWQQIQRRKYAASEGHSSHKSSSDVPWAIGAAVVTIPSCAYLLQPDPNKGHGHGHDEGEHGEHEGRKEGEEDSEEVVESEGEQPEDDQEGGEQGSHGDSNEGEGTSDDDSTKPDSGDQSRPDHSVQDAGQGSPDKPRGEDPKATGSYKKDSGSNVEGVRFKGATSGGTEEGVQGDTRKHIPDAKGGAKKRIESDYGKMQGVLNEADPENTDKVSLSRLLVALLIGKDAHELVACRFQDDKLPQSDVCETVRPFHYTNQTFYGSGQQSRKE